jgi:ABC transport system ATP-binding/permease protein
MISYLQTLNISRRIGDNLLFEDVSININKDDKVALVGVNGSGKSSLLDIIAGKESPDSGSVNMLRGLRISILEQEPVLDDEKTIIDELFSTGSPLTNIIKDYEKSLLSGNDNLIQKMIEKMDDNKAWDYEVSVKQILYRLKLPDLTARISTLSGGERKRVALAKALVESSDLLILDEPTNHLDLDMIEWLEDYLSEVSRTLLMVTHDRYFLDRVCNVILEISDKNISSYAGNYSYFIEKKQEKELAAKANSERSNNLYRRELEWIRRMPKARRHKSKSRIGAFEEVKERSKLNQSERTININVHTARMGKKILEIKNISKSFGNLHLIKDFSYMFSRYEKAGLVGRNGSGKSTLMNIIAGLTEPDKGTVERGETVRFGYYRQEGIKFDEEMTVFDAVSKIAEKVTLNEGTVVTASQFMNYFLFPPERQRTFIKKLSGGEKRRLYLLTVLMKNPNFLLLDEPTNDLDILTLNVLEEYLAGFRGCVIIASHDRYFMDKIVDHIFEYKGNGIIKDFPGNYTRLRDTFPDMGQSDSNRVKDPGKEDKQRKKVSEVPGKQTLTYREKKEVESLEQEISEAISEKQLLESEITGGKLPNDLLRSKSERLGELLRIIDEKEMRWLELNDR